MNHQNHWLSAAPAALNEQARSAAEARQAELTKPPGALGILERIAVQLAAMQGVEKPSLDRIQITVFAGDHGVVAEGVSAFPQAVTAEMIRNFARGGAAISVLAREAGAGLEVVNLGSAFDPGELPGVLALDLGPGTANMVDQPAMTETQLADALQAGREAVQRAREQDAQLFIGGEMGIGNTTAATAVASALLDLAPEVLCGPGTGLDGKGVAHKCDIIYRALKRNAAEMNDPLSIMRCVGGFELAALTGAYLASAQAGIPALVDGFITTAAALTATRLQPRVADWLIYSHGSAEPGHAAMLRALEAEPMISLGMRLGEGSGAATAVPLLRLACSLHAGMATFAEAGVSEKL